jgi:type II secretory pathway pseudopilin PulG
MKRRNGFTLVELLVAMALIIAIMAIVSQAFVQATTTFRNLKALGDMANKLRATTTLLQHDLAADHFAGKKRLSNPNFWVNGPPSQGYFRIWQGTPPNAGGNVLEGGDADGFPSWRTVDHALAFTIKLRGDQMNNFLTAGLTNTPATDPTATSWQTFLAATAQFGPAEARYQLTTPGSYNYQWAEVAWFLQPQIDPNTGVQDSTTGNVPLYSLYRRQLLAVPDNNLVPAQPYTNVSEFLEVSTWNNGGNIYFNSPMDLTVPTRRLGSGGGVYPTLAQQGASANLINADLQLTDVVSFDVRLIVLGMLGSPDPSLSLFHPTFVLTPAQGLAQNPPIVAYNNSNPAFYPTNPASGMVFDTWSSLTDALTGYPGFSNWNLPGLPTSIPLWNPTLQAGPIIQALQITIRIWDEKTSQTREVTIVQAM